jgi:hypothetical protein
MTTLYSHARTIWLEAKHMKTAQMFDHLVSTHFRWDIGISQVTRSPVKVTRLIETSSLVLTLPRSLPSLMSARTRTRIYIMSE